MYSTFSNPCWTIDICMVSSGRLQQAKSRSTVTPAGTDGLYTAWQRKNTWVLGTHEWFIWQNTNGTGTKYGGWRKSLLLLSLVLLCLSGPFCFMVLFFLLSFLFTLHLSEERGDGVEGGIWGAGGGSWFLFFFSPPHPFLHLSVNICQREKEKCDRWRWHALVLVQKDYKGVKSAWPSEGSFLSCCDPIYAPTVHPDEIPKHPDSVLQSTSL